jgi:hypothetical protein
LHEAVSGGLAAVELKTVVPQLGVVEEVERSIGDTLVFWRPAHAEIAITSVQPWQGITHAVVLGEFNLVGSGEEVVIRIIISVSYSLGASVDHALSTSMDYLFDAI